MGLVFKNKVYKKSSILALFAICLLVNACQQEKKPGNSFLSGKIINQNEKKIRLFQNGKLFDSITLSKRGEFQYQFPKGSQGVFTFKHMPESQLFYLEKGDSLLMRLNTLRFDETLTFSGKGAVENNFLIHQFLENEDNNDLVYSYFKKDPKIFLKAIDSIKAQRKKNLTSKIKKHNFSKKFTSVAKKLVGYEYYSLKERYNFLIRKYSPEQTKNLPKNYLAYRKKINLNDSKITACYIYQRFLDSHLMNLSIDYCEKQNRPRSCYRMTNYSNTLRRLKLSDSLFTFEPLRNRYLGHFGKLAILRSSDNFEMEAVSNLLKKADYPEGIFTELRKLMDIQNLFLKEHNFSELAVHDANGNNFKLDKIFGPKPVAIFFWDLYSPQLQKLAHQKVFDLQRHYPDIHFIGININSKQTDMWKKSLKNFNYNRISEVQLQKNPYKTKLFRNFSKQLILLTPGNHLVLSNEQMFTTSIKSALERLSLEF